MRPPTSRRREHETLERDRHRAHRAAAVVGEHRGFAVGMVARHLARVHAGRRRLARGREVHRDHAQAELLQALAQVEQLAALGVEGAGHVGGAHAAGGDGERPAAARPAWPAARLQRRLRGGHRRLARDVRQRRRRVAAVPAVEAAHRARRRIVERRRAVAEGPPHRQHAHGVGRRGRRRGGLGGLVVVAGAHAEQALLQLAVGSQRLRRHLVRDAAVDHHADAVGHVDRHAEVLLDQQHRDLAAGQLAQRLHHLLDDQRRQALGGLVHHQQARLEQQRAADGQHLLLATRQLRAAVALALGQPREHRVDAVEVAPAPGHQAQRLVDRQRRPDAAALRHVGDAAPRDLVRRQAEDLVTAPA